MAKEAVATGERIYPGPSRALGSAYSALATSQINHPGPAAAVASWQRALENFTAPDKSAQR